MRLRLTLPAVVAVLAALLGGCGDDAEPSGSDSAQTQPDDDPAEPAGETDDEAEDQTDTPDQDSGGGVSGLNCAADLEVTGDVTGTLEGGTGTTNNAGGPAAFYQILGEDLLLSVYSDGDGFDRSVILQAGAETYGSAPGAAGLDVAEDGTGAELDVDVELVPSGDRTAHVAGSITC